MAKSSLGPRMTAVAENQGESIELAETFAEVARILLDDENDVDTTLERICHLAVTTVENCETAGISIIEAGRITSLSMTDDLPRIVDEIQAETQEGPCIDAIKHQNVFITGSLSHEQRWTDFSQRAHDETGVESVLALRLFANEGTMGALNLYSSIPAAFDDQDIAVGSVFAAHAAVALAGAKRWEHLEAKAASRDVIGMAKGIVMARENISDDEAFDILRRASQRMNIKLRDVAARVVNSPNPTPTTQ